jgi:hypothetical protein
MTISVFNIKDHKQKQSTGRTYDFEKEHCFALCSRKQKARMVLCWFVTPLYINCSFTSFLSMQTCTYKKKKNDLNVIFSWYCFYNRTTIQNTIPWFEYSHINMYSFSSFSQFLFILPLVTCGTLLFRAKYQLVFCQ